MTAFALVLAVRWTLGPIRVRWNPSDLPTSGEVADWVMPRKGNAKALLRAANWSYMAGRDAEGTAYVDQAARVAEDDAESLCRIASIYAARGRDSEARGLIDRAETLRPDLPPIHAALAKLHENRREYREAAASWRRFAQLSSESRDPQMRLNGEQIEAVHARARRCERMDVEGAR